MTRSHENNVPHRVRSGVPAGGQFVAHERAEDAITLVPDLEQRQPPRHDPISPTDAMTLAKSFAQAQSSLYGIARHDIDDIAQDVVPSMLEQRRATANPFTRNLVRTAVRHAAWAAERAQLGRVRHEETGGATTPILTCVCASPGAAFYCLMYPHRSERAAAR